MSATDKKAAAEQRQRKPKMTKDIVPEDFTLALALVDAVPVLFFGASMLVISLLFSDWLFLLGALLCLIGGAGKVLWKIIVVLKKRNVWPLFVQMRILMPAGFLLMLLSLILNAGTIRFSAISAVVLSFPSVIFFAAGVAGMVLMIVFAAKLDSSDVRANWIEQLTNGAAQAAFFIGLLLHMRLKPFIQGNFLLLICCAFYLAWWALAFKPEGAVKGLRSGWLLIPAAVAGVLAVVRIVNGISGISMEKAVVSTAQICIAGAAVYVVLLAGTWIFFKRPVTTELILIVGWLTMTAAELNSLYAVGAFSGRTAIVLLAVSAVMAAVSLVCYLWYYKLDAVKGYYDGMAPLIMVALMTVIILVKLWRINR